MMDSRVDLPQPDGPDTVTNSPWEMSRCTSARAWVSTSSVMKTFLSPSMRISGWPLSSMMSPFWAHFSLMRSESSQRDVSDRITRSPSASPESTSTVSTDERPSATWTRAA